MGKLGAHPYATDSTERRLVPLLLAGSAVAASWGISRLLTALGWTVPWYFDAPSVMTMYGIFHGLFDRFVWKWSPLRTIGLIAVPDLSGPWRFRIKSSHNGAEIDANVTIHQTWRGMLIKLETDQSRSSSIIASLLTEDPNEFVLNYEFANTPKQDAPPTMHTHRGSAELRFAREPRVLSGDGEYYSGRDRVNQGRISVERM